MPRLLDLCCNGVRGRYKRLQLDELLFAYRIGVEDITETHLRKGEIARMRFSHHTVPNGHCRDAEERIGGGVTLMVHRYFEAGVFALPCFLAGELETCSICPSPTAALQTAMAVARIYGPPK